MNKFHGKRRKLKAGHWAPLLFQSLCIEDLSEEFGDFPAALRRIGRRKVLTTARMDELTISYGLLAPQARASHDLHILPITKILYPEGHDDYFLTCSRDGSVIKHRFDASGATIQRNRMQAHSDWVTDIIQVSRNKFITVSHDFSIVLLILNEGSDTWETRIIGDHEDYIKCVVHIPTEGDDFLFATGGLDKKVKVWRLEDDEASLVHEFHNVTENDDTGSIYAMAGLPPSSERNYDLIAGDCNGDLVMYSVKSRHQVQRISKAHDANIKVVKTVNNSTRLVSSCSDGLICVWDLTTGDSSVRKTDHYKLGESIWGIYGSSLSLLYVTDSRGSIRKIDISTSDTPKVSKIYSPEHLLDSGGLKDDEIGQGGILDLMSPSDDEIVFSKSTDSNLYRLKIRTGEITVSKGGFALTKSSLLTNRRHVITKNTKGEIQRWDIVTCELVNTFDPAEGDFDEVVAKYTSKEILSHWCSLSVKVGMLFVKLSPQVLNTEVYGTALKDYRILNDVDVNPDDRYNLGKIIVNSLFNEFVSYEMQKDKAFRKQLTARKKDASKDFAASAQDLSSNPGESRPKDKRRISAFYRFSSTTPNLENSASSVSAPNTPSFSSEAPSMPIDERPLLPPSAMSAGDGSDFGNVLPTKGNEGRTLSSGSLITRKLKLLRSQSRSGTGANTPAEPHAIVSSDVEDSATEDENIGDRVEWNHLHNGDSSGSQQMADVLFAKLNPIASSEDSVVNTTPGKTNSAPKTAPNYMADFIRELFDGYKQQYNANSSSLKLLTRRLPETKIIRDPSSPIIRIKNGVLLVVHSWSKSSCGGRVLFTTYLPAARNLDDDSGSILQESEEDGDSNEEDEKLHKFDLVDNEYGSALNRRQIFEQLEKNLPFWFAKCLFCDSMTAKKQPKLNFLIEPWQDDGHPTAAAAQPQPQPPHHRLKFGRSKSADVVPRSTELPKISEANVKLIAPGMIKVKKIKVYIVDRFETKSPEMKAKIDPSEWIELLCKNQVLDNDMTLSTVRTLYWKAQGEIIFQYRRKVAASYTATTEGGLTPSKDT